jgi:beta-lactam-binding protein with PASTA domain
MIPDSYTLLATEAGTERTASTAICIFISFDAYHMNMAEINGMHVREALGEITSSTFGFFVVLLGTIVVKMIL